MEIRLTQPYVLDAGDPAKPVSVTVTIGEGQKGHTDVFLDGIAVATGSGTVSYALGPGGALAGRKIRIISVVTDTSEDTNRTSVTYGLTGGNKDRKYHVEHEVDFDLETVDYIAVFKFV